VNTGKTAFVVGHDFIMATYLANRVLVFDGGRGAGSANNPFSSHRWKSSIAQKLSIFMTENRSRERIARTIV
jgi:translation initiation factor RLI1